MTVKSRLSQIQKRGQSFTFISLNPKRETSGFTLVELIVVIALVVVLASLGIPFALRARLQSNEAAAIGNLRTISSAAEAFRGTQNPPSYATTLAVMATSTPPYLDASWINSNQRQGYNYAYAVSGDGETYSTVASPRSPNVSGVNTYCVDQTGVIRNYGTGAGAAGSQTGCATGGTPV